MGERRPAAARRPARGFAALAVAVALAAVLAGGCAAIPSSGTPQSAAIPQPAGGIPQGYGLTLQPPQPGWSTTQVVNNFLLASSNAADNYRLARQYLTPKASRSWHPSSGVTILSGAPQVILAPHGINGGPGGERQVQATGQELATLTASGQYSQAATGATAPVEVFTLQQNSQGVYQISQLPQARSGAGPGLLLTSDLFRLVYTPRNLYYYAQRNGILLPDPIFVPVQGASTVSTLVTDLSHNPPGGAATTSFPVGARLAGVQVFPGPSGGRTAIVNIAVPRGTSDEIIRRMAVQLVCTLTSPAFSPPLFHAVRIKINGQAWDASGPALTFRSYQRYIPQWHPGMDVYYLTPGGGVRTLGPKSGRSTALRGAGIGQPSLTQVAVSPAGTQIAGIGAVSGAVYTGRLIPSAKPGEPPSAGPLRARLQGSFTALSYDQSGALWIAGRVGKRRGIWVLWNGRGPPQRVYGLSSVQGKVTGLRVAPDGVRVAMIIGSAANAQVWLVAAKVNNVTAAISVTRPVPLGGQGVTGVLTGVKALTWYDEDHLLVVAGPSAATHLWEVPVDGEQPTSVLPGAAGFASVTAAGQVNPLYLGFADGRLWRAFGLYQFLVPITAGHAPAYPG